MDCEQYVYINNEYESGRNRMDTTNFPLFSQVKADHDVTTYIGEQNKSMKALHFTEHSFAHVGVVCERTAYILEKLGFDEHSNTPFDLEYCMTRSRTALYKAQVAKLKERYAGKLDILCGLEWDLFSDDDPFSAGNRKAPGIPELAEG